MKIKWIAKRVPSAQALQENRFLRPLARYLHHHFLWQFNRRGVAGGVAAGLFFGILVPFGQIPLAALASIIFRVNLPVAAFSTLISNPLTFPPLYLLAYRIGDVLTGSEPVPSLKQIQSDVQQAVAIQERGFSGWFSFLIDWLQSVGLPLIIGLVVLATTAGLLGYFIVDTVWKLRTRQRWRERLRRFGRF